MVITSNKKRKVLVPWLFLAPSLIVSILVVLGPTAGTLILSLTDWNGVTAPSFVGFTNYNKLVNDPVFWRALTNNTKWLLIFSTIPSLLALFVANVLRTVQKSQMFFRSVFLMSY